MSRIGQHALVVSHPRPGDFPARAAFITADHADGTVDVAILNPHSTGPASVREASMPAVQTMGPIPVCVENSVKPTDYRGRWIAVVKPSAPHLVAPGLPQDEQDALASATDGEAVRVSDVSQVSAPLTGPLNPNRKQKR